MLHQSRLVEASCCRRSTWWIRSCWKRSSSGTESRHARPREGDGVLHRHLRSRTHREVGGVHCVADERHFAGHPAACSPSAEPSPPTAVAEQRMTAEVLGEHVGEHTETVFVTGSGD